MHFKFDRLFITVVLATLAPFVAFFLFALWFSQVHGASLSRLGQIRPGMTNKQVTAILGRPAALSHSADGSESWYYGRTTFCEVKVYFSPDGGVSDIDHDH